MTPEGYAIATRDARIATLEKELREVVEALEKAVTRLELTFAAIAPSGADKAAVGIPQARSILYKHQAKGAKP